ncbi:MAG: DUF362 domain-containing protein [Magnetococcales bacterium]|nr:DUF362 domain-containing protein [Magnetococcales bacterium]
MTAALAAGFAAGGYWFYDETPYYEKKEILKDLKEFRMDPTAIGSEIAVVRGSDHTRMVRALLTQLGGLEAFIKPGERVLLKPNIGWDRQPEQAANTGPELVEAMVVACREAGAGKVLVTDVSLNDPKRCFHRSGIGPIALKAGAEVVIPTERDFVATVMKGDRLKSWPVAEIFHQVDRVINLPIVKHHSLSGATLAMKNWFGAIGGARNRLHQDIHVSIADLGATFRPTLTVMDATRVLLRNGPTGGSLDDVARRDTLIAGVDEVAVDAWSLRLLDKTPEEIPFLAYAQARGLGMADLSKVRIHEQQIG